MAERTERNLIKIENTKFIFRTNFSGDPARDNFGSDRRRANLIIPDKNQAMNMINDGFNVKQTKPRDEDDPDFEPTYFIPVNVNYNTDWPPKIYLVSGDNEPVLLDEETVKELDYCYVLNVNAILNPYENSQTGTKSLYVRTMYVEQDIGDDPFASKYAHPRKLETEHPEEEPEYEALPFD